MFDGVNKKRLSMTFGTIGSDWVVTIRTTSGS